MNELSSQLGQSIVVENRPGAGNTIGMAEVARSSPDGYTVLVNSSSHTVVPATFSHLPFDTLNDLVPVVPFGVMPTVIVVSPKKKYQSLSDLVSAAKAHPGVLNYSSAGAGNFSHLATEVFVHSANIDIVHVPAPGAPEALLEVLAERADVFFSPLSVALPFLKNGSLQALAVTGAKRASALPDVPTTAEAGFPNTEYNFWVGLFVPAKTPEPIIGRLHDETIKAVQVPDVVEKLHNLGIDPLLLSQAAFAKQVEKEISLNTRIATAAGLKMN